MDNKVKWHTIEDIELQDPKNMTTFYAKDFVWTEIQRTNVGIDRVVKILSDRDFNFIRGEEMNPNAPCSFIRKKNNQEKGLVLH